MTRIHQDAHGYYFILNGVMHGHWRSRPEALAALTVELRRSKTP